MADDQTPLEPDHLPNSQSYVSRRHTTLWDLLATRVAEYRPHRHPKTTSLLFLWIFGLYAMFLARPFDVPPENMSIFLDKQQAVSMH
jgi:hypothetical protein